MYQTIHINKQSIYLAMAYPPFSFFILTCLIISTSHAAPVDDVCTKTTNPPLCIAALGGPESHKDNLVGLAEIGFQTAGMAAVKFVNLFTTFASSPRVSANAKANAVKCGKLYDRVFKGLITPAHEAARVGRWADVVSPVRQIVVGIDTCEMYFNGNSPVHEDSRIARVAAEAIVVIAGFKS
ncbi:hypothetical protein CASFOL_020419 [Castilleja foliolosa]|uniref:Pectinesterase inhibitor domain-containing protein n=1 Tax=Castilleja foliolosa TaxID=1961234 RepID=A0ABD3D2A3_9LAMI